MEADEGAAVEWIEQAHAYDVVVHGGYVPVRTFLGTCCRDFYRPIRRRQFAWFNREVTRTLCCAISLTAKCGGIVFMPGVAVAGPVGAAHSSDSRAIGLIEITADIAHLESVSATQKESTGPSPDGRLSHVPSLIRAAGRDERCGVSGETCVLLTPRTTAMHARVCQWQRDQARERRRNVRFHVGSRHFRRTVNDMPSFRPQCSLAWNRLAALEVSGAAPAPKPCSSGPAILGKRDASGSSSGPALHEARTPMGASAGSSRIFSLESHFARPHQKPMRLTASLSTLAKYLQRWLRSWTGSKADVR